MNESNTIDAQLIRAAMACQGVNDHRTSLNGIFLGANGDIVGTNGHCLFKVPGEPIVGQDTIITINGTIPVAAKTVSFDFVNRVVTTDKGKMFSFTVLDGKYPPYDRVIPDETRSKFSDGFSVDASLMAKVETVFGKGAPLVIKHAGDQAPLHITSSNIPGAVLVIMPLRNSGTTFQTSN